MIQRLLITAMVLLFPAALLAGEFSNGTYSSNLGYTITPPTGWVRMDASNANGLKGHLPKNVNPDSLNRLDVVFFPNSSKCDPSLSGDNARIENNEKKLRANKRTPASELEKAPNEWTEDNLPDYVPSISVMVLSDKLSSENLSKEDMPSEFRQALAAQKKNSTVMSSFSISKATVESRASQQALVVTSTFKLGNRKIKSEQTVLTKGKKSLLITCTYDEASPNDLDKGLCKNTVNSIQFK